MDAGLRPAEMDAMRIEDLETWAKEGRRRRIDRARESYIVIGSLLAGKDFPLREP